MNALARNRTTRNSIHIILSLCGLTLLYNRNRLELIVFEELLACELAAEFRLRDLSTQARGLTLMAEVRSINRILVSIH